MVRYVISMSMRDFTDLTIKQVQALCAQSIETRFSESKDWEALADRLGNLCVEYMTGKKSIKEVEAYLDLERDTQAKDEFIFQERE